MYLSVHAVRDQWLVATLNSMNSKLDSLMRTVQSIIPDCNTSSLPDGLVLPLKSEDELREFEELCQDASAKNAVVRVMVMY